VNIQTKDIKKKIGSLPIEEQKEILALLEQYEKVKSKESAQSQFLPFVKMMWNGFIGIF
jgi:uncharacterized protein YfbU (UPF0304 family)